jgi:hypothetical protein
MTYHDTPKWLKHEIEQFHQAQIEILRQMTFDDLITTRSVFLRSGEITNAGELVSHVLDEFMIEPNDVLFDALRQRVRSRIHPDKIGYYVAMMNDEYEDEFDRTLNRFTHEFIEKYSLGGKINWRKLAGL